MAFPGVTPLNGTAHAQGASPAELERLREENRRLQEQIDALKATIPPPPQAAPVAAPATVEPGCILSGATKYCTGWHITVQSVEPQSGTSATLGRFIPEDASRISVEDHKAMIPARAEVLRYQGAGFLNARSAGSYSFTVELSERRRDKCGISLTIDQAELLTVSHRRPEGAGSMMLQAGLYPIGFDFTCQVYRQGRGEPSHVILRMLAPDDGAMRPFIKGEDPAHSDILHEAP